MNGSSYSSNAFFEWYFTPFLQTIFNSIEVKIRSYDVIHSFQSSNPSIGIPTIISKVFKNKVVFIDQDDAWKNGFAANFNTVKRLVYEFLEDYLPLCLADTTTVASEYLQHKITRLGVDKNRVCLIPNGSEIDEIEPVDKTFSRKKLGLDLDSKILISIGHYAFVERYVFLFEAISNVVRDVPNVEFLIVGEQGLPNEILLRYRDIMSHVKLAGYQPYDQLKYYLSAADIALLPMADTTIEKARFPGRLGEYMAAGIPVVSNSVGEVKIILEANKCGLTSDPYNVSAFSSNIMQLINDVGLRERLGRKAREIAEEQYSWCKIAKHLDDVYTTLLKLKSRPVS